MRGTITLPAGTYTLTGVANENDNASGDLDISSTLTLNGGGSKTPIIQAGTDTTNGVDRVLQIINQHTAEINSVTIRYGKAPNGIAGAGDNACNGSDGGGIYSQSGGTLILNYSVVISNRAGEQPRPARRSPSDTRQLRHRRV